MSLPRWDFAPKTGSRWSIDASTALQPCGSRHRSATAVGKIAGSVGGQTSAAPANDEYQLAGALHGQPARSDERRMNDLREPRWGSPGIVIHTITLFSNSSARCDALARFRCGAFRPDAVGDRGRSHRLTCEDDMPRLGVKCAAVMVVPPPMSVCRAYREGAGSATAWAHAEEGR